MSERLTISPVQVSVDRRLRQAAMALEATFLAQMLKETSLGKPPEGFGGGIGEGQFTSFLVDEQARLIASRGGLGLAESIFEALKGSAHVSGYSAGAGQAADA